MVSQYANDDYLNPKPTGEQVQPQDGQQPAPAAGGGVLSSLGDKWHSFIDHPENRAGMMQFAVNMLSGKGLGESIGSAAEASGRNIGAQQEAEAAQEAEDIKQRETEVKESQAESYKKISERPSASDIYYQKAAKALDSEAGKAWDVWKADPVGGGGVLADVKLKFPNIKSKDDLDRVGNEAALRYAQERVAATTGRGGGLPPRANRAPAQEFQPPPGAVPRNVNGQKVWYDPKTGKPVLGQFGA